MGSRLRSSPQKILECFLEVSAGKNSEGPAVEFIHPTDFEDKEALNCIPQFCFPCEIVTDAVQHYTFVLTDIEGKYRFGFCRLSPDVNKCLCVLSYLPWFKIFYELLNTISDMQRGEHSALVVPFLNSVLQEPPPQPGDKVHFKSAETSKELSFVAPDPSKLPSIPEDRNLTDYFSAVDPYNMIWIFCSMFFERRIIVTSKKLNLLTACTYGAASLLYPMYWQHMFVPIVPPHLLDYCCAPMPFLVGIHSSMMPRVRSMPLDEVVIFDADTNEIEVPFDDTGTLPSEVISSLKSTLKRPVYPIDDYVSRAFLVAMASLIGSYRDALRLKPGENIVFDRDFFVQSKSSELRPLFELMLQLQLFEQFIVGRLELLNAGRGFNDVFEQQIGLQGENQASWKSQYQQWMKKAHKKAKQGIKGAKSGLQDVKDELKPFMRNVKENLHVAKDNLRKGWKGNKEESDEMPNETNLKKSNSWSDSKQFNISHKLSPFSSRRSVCPSELKNSRDKDTGTAKLRPTRPPPPRPFTYTPAARRPRTSAMSMVDGQVLTRSPSPSRHSAPNLGQPIVGNLISLYSEIDETEDVDAPSSSDSEGTLKTIPATLDMPGADYANVIKPSEARHSGEDVPNDEKIPTKPPRRRSQDGKTSSTSQAKRKPAVPVRPGSRRNQSVDEIFESVAPAPPMDAGMSPLKHNSFSLLKDTVTALTPELQEWLTADAASRGLACKNRHTQNTREWTAEVESRTTNADCGSDDELGKVTKTFDSVLRDLKGLQSNELNHTPTDSTKDPAKENSAKSQEDWVSFG